MCAVCMYCVLHVVHASTCIFVLCWVMHIPCTQESNPESCILHVDESHWVGVPKALEVCDYRMNTSAARTVTHTVA